MAVMSCPFAGWCCSDEEGLCVPDLSPCLALADSRGRECVACFRMPLGLAGWHGLEYLPLFLTLRGLVSSVAIVPHFLGRSV